MADRTCATCRWWWGGANEAPDGTCEAPERAGPWLRLRGETCRQHAVRHDATACLTCRWWGWPGDNADTRLCRSIDRERATNPHQWPGLIAASGWRFTPFLHGCQRHEPAHG